MEPGEDGVVHNPYRVQFLRDHIVGREAVADGVDLRGLNAIRANSDTSV